jgi:hypothetical protein
MVKGMNLSQFWADFKKFDGWEKGIQPASTRCHWFFGRNLFNLKNILVKKTTRLSLGFYSGRD